MTSSSDSPPTDAATSWVADVSITDDSDASSSPPESPSQSTTEETGLGPSEIADLIIADRLVPSDGSMLPRMVKESASRFLGDAHYLERLYDVGHDQAAEEACEKYGHPAQNKGMCIRCGMDRMTLRQHWLQGRGRA